MTAMPTRCPHCRAWDQARTVDPSTNLCPTCGASLESVAGDTGVRLQGGPGACPTSFGPYRVLGVIGRGGMGVVYLARHAVTLEEVAIKTVRLRKRGLLHRIRREVLALARIRHPGLVRIIETGQSDGLPWYAMELLRGTTLHEELGKAGPSPRLPRPGPSVPPAPETRVDFVLAGGPLGLSPSVARGSTATLAEPGRPGDSSEVTTGGRPRADPGGTAATAQIPGSSPIGPDAPRTMTHLEDLELADEIVHVPIAEPERRGFLKLMAQLCRTLAYLHGEGIVHRDIKPSNVIIRPDGTPVLLDFGLASYFGSGGRESLEIGGKVEGTPEYMAPEQIRGELVDARSDLYALGCILYEGMTGRVPFRAGSPAGTLRAHLKVPPIPPRELVADLPEELESVILRLLAKRAGDRPGYARDVEEALGRLGADPGDWAGDRPARDYLYRPEFVGRADVLEALGRHIRLALRWPGRCIFLRGTSGVGKTRVIVELARRLEADGLSVVTGECLPIGVELEGDGGPGVRATPLHPFRALLQSVADACLENGPDEATRLLGPRAHILSECEPALINLPGLVDDDPPTSTESSGEGHRSRLIEALGETISEYGRNAPVVIFLDDLQWADALTLHFLALFHVGAWDSPNVAIVAAYRTEEEDDAMKGYRRVFADATTVELGPLGEDCLSEIIGGMLGAGEADGRLVGHLARRSGGNPFYVAEYLRAAVAEGLLRRDDRGAWRPADAEGNPADPESLDVAIPLPGSIRELVVRRLSRLTGDGRRLLELAAVFGREVDAELLEAVGLIGEAESMAALEDLLVAQILEECRNGRFRFAHDTLREVAYEQITPERRRELHRMAARAIERRHDRRDDFPRQYATLAHHWYRAIGDRSGDPLASSMAIDYLEKAVGHAVNSGMPAEAVGFGKAAARLMGVALPDGPAEIADALAAELDLIRRAMAGRSPLDLLDLPESRDPVTDRVIGLLLSMQLPAFISDQTALFALLAAKNLGLTLAHGHGSLAQAVYGMFGVVIRIIPEDSPQAHEFGLLALEVDRRRGRPMESDVLFLKNCFLDHWVAPVAESLADCDRGGEAGLASGSVLYGCYNHATYVVKLAASGAPLADVVRAAEERLGRVGHLVLVARFHCILERQLAMALGGRTDAPTSLTDGSFDEVRDLGFICRTTNASQVGHYHAARMKLHYFRGEYGDALDASDRAHAVRESCARQMVEVDLVLFRALTLLALAAEGPGPRRPVQLRHARELQSTLERWRADCEANFGHKTLLVRAEFARVEGRDDEALRLYREAAASAEVHGFRQFAALARELAGRHSGRIGNAEAARSEYRKAVEGYRAWGASAIAGRLESFA